MTLVSGASQYLNASRVANSQGLSPSNPSLLDDGTSTTTLLQSGRNVLSTKGIGLSANSRALTESFLNRSSDINTMFSLATGSDATTEGMQTQILAIRARMPHSQLAASILQDSADKVSTDTNKGTNVDTTA